jgi:AcrR family transcriptional regulator
VTPPAAVAPRRRDASRSREQLLAAASALFAERGFDRCTTRDVGERAGVDPALIARYFGSKAGLYLACLHDELGEAAPADLLTPGRVRGLVDRVDARGPGPVFQAAVRRHEDPRVEAATRDELHARLVTPLRDRLAAAGEPESDLLAQTAAAALTGVLVARSTGALEALAAADPERVTVLVDRLLSGLLDR